MSTKNNLCLVGIPSAYDTKINLSSCKKDVKFNRNEQKSKIENEKNNMGHEKQRKVVILLSQIHIEDWRCCDSRILWLLEGYSKVY